MIRKQDILGIQVSDLMITCGFTENYAKNLHQFISETFEYDDFNIETNGIVITITLKSFYYDVVILFKKKTLKNKTEVQILSTAFDNPYVEYYNNYVTFCKMLNKLKEKIVFLK